MPNLNAPLAEDLALHHLEFGRLEVRIWQILELSKERAFWKTLITGDFYDPSCGGFLWNGIMERMNIGFNLAIDFTPFGRYL